MSKLQTVNGSRKPLDPMEHKHVWERLSRKHGRKGRFFIQCTIPGCSIVRQATQEYGYLRVFHTGVSKGGKTKIKSYRLKADQEKLLNELGITFVQFVDEAFRKVL